MDGMVPDPPAAAGAANAGPIPLPPGEDSEAVEVDRVVSPAGTITLGAKVRVAAEIVAGRQVGVRVEGSSLHRFDLDTRQPLRTRANPLTPQQVQQVRGLRPAGPPPRPAVEPVRVQRLAHDKRSGRFVLCQGDARHSRAR